MLYFIHTTVWKTMFGKQADSLEKSTENEDECKKIAHLQLAPFSSRFSYILFLLVAILLDFSQ